MDKKGLNFVAGLGLLFLLFKLYSSGFLHDIGFMAINEVTNQNFAYSYSGDRVIYNTPLADLSAVLIDLVSIGGSILIMMLTGIWQVLGVASVYLSDLFKVAQAYIKEYLEKNKDKLEDEDEDKPEDTEKVKTATNPIVEILKAVKEMQEKQKNLEDKIDQKVEKTNIVNTGDADNV